MENEKYINKFGKFDLMAQMFFIGSGNRGSNKAESFFYDFGGRQNPMELYLSTMFQLDIYFLQVS